MNEPRLLVAGGMILVAAAIRVVPYVLQAFGWGDIHDVGLVPWNLSPLGAMCLFGGAQFADRRYAFAVPLLALFASDLAIGLMVSDLSFTFYPEQPAVYGSFFLIVCAGTFLRRLDQRALPRVLAIVVAALASQTSFFLITNFASWLTLSEMYPRSLAGLLQCYVSAIPFDRNSFLGMGLYAATLFGGLGLLEATIPALQEARLAREK